MSFFGFDATGRHDTAAPGFSQARDPFAGLSGSGVDDALEFEDTYDGLGDQLDETDDVFNEDTFGSSAPSGAASSRQNPGKDFDFFGQTAKVANAIEEEHLRYNRQQPVAKAAAPVQPSSSNAQYYSGYQQQPQQPARSGYEKYREAEPLPDLNIDKSIWGLAPKQRAQASPAPPVSQPVSRKMMSLEEVEAAMRSQPKKATPQPPVAEPAYAPSGGYPTPQQQYAPSPSHGHPVTILQRPQSGQPKSTPPVQELHAPPPQPQPHSQRQPQAQPTQILQNPNRLSGDASRIGAHGHQSKRSQGAIPNLAQLQQHPQLMQMSEEDKALFLDQETKRAKRNHKIWLLSKDNGLMTPQDKNFITRIQLQQLVAATGNPVEGSDASIAEDFYYQVYSHIRAGQRQNPSQPLSNFAQTYLYQTGSRQGGMRRHGRPAENHFQRMEQQVQRAVEAAKNKPKNPQLVIAGSLGKISFSNAKTPKPLLNIRRTESETPRPTSARGGGLDRKTILRNVEKVYQTLMQIEDHVRLIPPPITNPSDEELQNKHKEWATILEAYNAKLWHELKVHEPIGATVPHPFIAFISCAKGEKAIPRIFPHLTFEQRTTILTMIVYHLDQLEVVQGAAINTGEATTLNARMREKIELFISSVMPSLMQYFNDTGLDIVDGVLNLIATKLNVDLIARTRIGVSMLTLILSRAVLLKQTGAGNADQWEKWYVKRA